MSIFHDLRTWYPSELRLVILYPIYPPTNGGTLPRLLWLWLLYTNSTCHHGPVIINLSQALVFLAHFFILLYLLVLFTPVWLLTLTSTTNNYSNCISWSGYNWTCYCAYWPCTMTPSFLLYLMFHLFGASFFVLK